MSTEIAEIKGRREVYRTSGNVLVSPTVKYEESILNIGRFSGGIDGSMVQLTMGTYPYAYIQLNKEQVNELIQVLTDCFDYDKYPSE